MGLDIPYIWRQKLSKQCYPCPFISRPSWMDEVVQICVINYLDKKSFICENTVQAKFAIIQ